MFRSQDIQVFIFLTIYDLPNLWRHDEYYYMKQGAFLNIFLTKTHWVTKLGPLRDITKSNDFQESFD